MQCTINTSVCVCSSHTTGDLMLIAVDQKDRALERTCSLYILKPIASDTLHCLTITILDNWQNHTYLLHTWILCIIYHKFLIVYYLIHFLFFILVIMLITCWYGNGTFRNVQYKQKIWHGIKFGGWRLFVEITKYNSPIANLMVFYYTMWPSNRQI